MSIVDTTIARIQAIALKVAQVKSAPNYPVEESSVLPMVITYMKSGDMAAQNATDVKFKAVIQADLHIPYTVGGLKEIYTRLNLMVPDFLQRLGGDPTLNGSVSTIVYPVTFTQAPGPEYNKAPTLAVSFQIPVKFNLLTPITQYGPELITNGGLEDSGSPVSIFYDWADVIVYGSVAREASVVYSGQYACLLTAGITKDEAINQVIYGLKTGTNYLLEFYSRGDGTNAGRYYVQNYDEELPIIAYTDANALTSFLKTSVQFTIPAGCTSVKIILQCPATVGGYCYFDDVSLREVL